MQNETNGETDTSRIDALVADFKEKALIRECNKFVERMHKLGYSDYEIDRTLGFTFGVIDN